MKRILKIGFFSVLLIAVGLTVFVMFFLDGFLKTTFEKKGSQALGAQVDIGSLTTSLLKQSVELKDIQVANAKKLEQNMVQVGLFHFDFDLDRALERKLYIDELLMEGIAFNTERTTPAKPVVASDEGETSEEAGSTTSSLEGFDLMQGIQFKSPEEILKSENLETLQAIDNVKNEASALQTKWQDTLDNQLGKSAIDDFNEKVKALQEKAKSISGPEDIETLTEEIQTLRDELEGQIDQIKNMKSDLKTDIQEVKNKAADLKELPQRDFERLKKKYSLDLKSGTGLVSALISGPVTDKINRARQYYQQFQPYFKTSSSGGSGEAAEETKQKTSPDFVIRHGTLGMTLFGQPVMGEIKEFSDNQKLHALPLSVNFKADKNIMFDKLDMDILIDRTKLEPHDTVTTTIDSLRLKGMDTGETVKFDDGRVNIEGKVEILNENDLRGSVDAKAGNVIIAMTQTGDDQISKTLASTLSSVENFYIQFRLFGTLDKYELGIKSDLDAILNEAVKKVFQSKIKEFEKDLKGSIVSATKGPLAEAGVPVSGFADIQKGLNGKQSSYEDLLNQTTKKALLPKVPGGSKLLKGLKLPF